MSYVIKFREGEGTQGVRQIRVKGSQLRNSNGTLYKSIKELTEMIKTNKIDNNTLKNIRLSHKINSEQPRTLSQIQNIQPNKVITSVTQKLRSISPTSNSIQSQHIASLRQPQSVDATISYPNYVNIASANNLPDNAIKTNMITATTSNLPPIAPIKTTIQPHNNRSTQSFILAKPTTMISTNNNNLSKPVVNFNKVVATSSTATNTISTQYKIQVKNPRNCLGSPTISSTSTFPSKLNDNNTSKSSQPIYIRRDLSSSTRDDSNASPTDSNPEFRSDLDDEETDDDLELKEDFMTPSSKPSIKTFSVSSSNSNVNKNVIINSVRSFGQNGIPISATNHSNRFGKTVKVSVSEVTKAPKIKVIASNSYTSVSNDKYFLVI